MEASIVLLTFSLTVLHRYYHNITSNTLVVLEAMATHGVKTFIYSSTCATYGEPEKMPITEVTPQVSVQNLGSRFITLFIRLFWKSLVCVDNDILFLLIYQFAVGRKMKNKNFLVQFFFFRLSQSSAAH